MATWMIRAGRGGVYAKDWVENGYVGIGWDFGGVDIASTSHEQLRGVYEAANPDFSAQKVAFAASQASKFAHTIVAGSTVVTYDPEARVYHIGKITGECVPSPDVDGVTYTRKVDFFTLSVLSGIAQSAMKFTNDVRLMAHMKELDEPFESKQVGSSAMAYKRNPMRCERISALARYVIADAQNPAMTAGAQWLERTLDDSANRRISIPEAFLAVDGILTLYANIVGGLTVYPKVIEKHLNAELPFMVTENILMYCVRKGGDRQELHEAIRKHSVAAGLAVKQEGADNDLLERIAADPVFKLTREEIQGIISEGHFTGMAEEQTEEYLKAVRAVLDANRDVIAAEPAAEINI